MMSKQIRFSSKVILSLTVTFGMLLGGIGTVALVAMQKIHLPTILGTATILYGVGVSIGLGYGLVLAFLSSNRTPLESLKDIDYSAVAYFFPAILIGWIVTGWGATLPISLMRGLVPTTISVAMWLVILGTTFFTGSIVWHALVKIWQKTKI